MPPTVLQSVAEEHLSTIESSQASHRDAWGAFFSPNRTGARNQPDRPLTHEKAFVESDSTLTI